MLREAHLDAAIAQALPQATSYKHKGRLAGFLQPSLCVHQPQGTTPSLCLALSGGQTSAGILCGLWFLGKGAASNIIHAVLCIPGMNPSPDQASDLCSALPVTGRLAQSAIRCEVPLTAHLPAKAAHALGSVLAGTPRLPFLQSDHTAPALPSERPHSACPSFRATTQCPATPHKSSCTSSAMQQQHVKAWVPGALLGGPVLQTTPVQGS